MRIWIFYSPHTSPAKNSSPSLTTRYKSVVLLFSLWQDRSLQAWKISPLKKRYTAGHKLCISKGGYVQKIRGHIVTPIVALSSANNIQSLYNKDIAQRLLLPLLHNHKTTYFLSPYFLPFPTLYFLCNLPTYLYQRTSGHYLQTNTIVGFLSVFQ